VGSWLSTEFVSQARPNPQSTYDATEFGNMVRREFGSKDKLAISIAGFSIARYEADGDNIVFSTLQTCSDEKDPPPAGVRDLAEIIARALEAACLHSKNVQECLFAQRKKVDKGVDNVRLQAFDRALQVVCLHTKTVLECLFEQRKVVDTLHRVLSPITVENDEISWDRSAFEGD
jgi:hypothetical protein